MSDAPQETSAKLGNGSQKNRQQHMVELSLHDGNKVDFRFGDKIYSASTRWCCKIDQNSLCNTIR